MNEWINLVYMTFAEEQLQQHHLEMKTKLRYTHHYVLVQKGQSLPTIKHYPSDEVVQLREHHDFSFLFCLRALWAWTWHHSMDTLLSLRGKLFFKFTKILNRIVSDWLTSKSSSKRFQNICILVQTLIIVRCHGLFKPDIVQMRLCRSGKTKGPNVLLNAVQVWSIEEV